MRIYRLMRRNQVFLCALLSIPTVAPAVRAQTTATPPDLSLTTDQSVAARTRASAGDGALLLLAQTPTLHSRQATAVGLGGYDSASKTALFETVAEIHVWGPFSLRGGAVYTQAGQRIRPIIGARAQLLTAESQGIDGALGVFYRPEGLTEPEGEIEAVASIGRGLGPAYLIANLAYGQDPEGNERDGEVRIAGMVPIGERVVLGVDSRVRFDLGSSSAKLAASGEPAFDLLAPGRRGLRRAGGILAQAGPSARRVSGVSSYGVFAMGPALVLPSERSGGTRRRVGAR